MRYIGIFIASLLLVFLAGCAGDTNGFCEQGHRIENSIFDEHKIQTITSGTDGVIEIRVLFYGIEDIDGRTGVLYLAKDEIRTNPHIKIPSDSGSPQPSDVVISGQIATGPCTDYGAVFNTYYYDFEMKFKEHAAAVAFVDEIDSYFAP